MPTRDYITVSELNFYIGQVINAEDLLHNVPVIGEVSGCSVVAGNCYFTLKDESAQIKIVYFQVGNKFVPSNGEKVLVRGAVNYYEPNGQISLKAYEITRFGIGLMHEKYIALKEKLESEGLFKDENKKPIPKYPVNIGIITSTKGAAMQDMISTLFGKGNRHQNVSFIDVRVQGDACVSDILTALAYSDSYGFDVIVLARGGGSFEDLFPFNDERLVRAIYSMKTPIISAIGHETDYTLCDFVADYRAITPTAGAAKVYFDVDYGYQYIIGLISKIKSLTQENYKAEQERILENVETISDCAHNLISSKYAKIMHLAEIAKIRVEQNLQTQQDHLKQTIALLDNLNPSRLLMNGYFRVVQNGKTLNSLKEVNVGEKIEIIGNKEKATALIEKKENL